MKVEFDADYKDFAEISYLAWKQYPMSKRLFPFLTLYLLVPMICSFLVIIFVQENWWASILTFILVFSAVFYFYPIPTLGGCRDTYLKSLGNNSYQIEIYLSDKGIKVNQLGDEYLYGWQNIVSTLDTNNRLCFFTRDNIGISIPKRALISINEQAKLIAFAKSRMSQDNSE